jgi:hypothetical protein
MTLRASLERRLLPRNQRRLVQFTTGMANIRDDIPFPRVPGFAEF